MAAVIPSELPACQEATEAALAELRAKHDKVRQISDYCRTSYKSDDDGASFDTTKKYVNDVLLSVAYNVHLVGVQLTNTLSVQHKELERVDVALRSHCDRSSSQLAALGNRTYKTRDYVKSYARPQLGVLPLGVDERPQSAAPRLVQRVPLDFDGAERQGVARPLFGRPLVTTPEPFAELLS